MAAWAVVSALTAVAKDYKGLLLTRFFLGITEAPYYPGAYVDTGLWLVLTSIQALCSC